ncbi:uncharacterized protein Gasu_34830 [Galdieria sulphuraria]|uniref:Glycosyltransferase n=1 Tax=Galdieria sulphuraria TaxID=130081 RepID=M2XGB9_GALSU|nr:uncharacterized protein Gasu_34830 [Galdieria sulphuraria]EME29092.1 hypothetical protein Gasu_34830 [Galdieria sulphuraria]|eukprot:XP_005705612.1 hypothetical protein Gasu_34830 [Galdieria sulphuraria]
MWKIKNLCYAPKRGSFVVYKNDVKLLPKFVRDSSKLVQLNHKPQLSSNIKWIRGVSLLFDDLRMEESGAHLYFHLLPVLSGWRMAKERWPVENISMTFQHLKTRKPADKQLLDLLLYHTPEKQMVELNHSRMTDYDAICWEHAIRIDQSYVGTADSFSFSLYVKQLVQDKYRIQIPQHCKHTEIDKKNQVWVIQRRVRARQIINIDDLIQFLENRGISRENIRVFDSPNAVCSSTGCFGYPVCDDITESSKQTCRKSGHRLEEDIKLFSQITLLLSIHGAGNVHYLWMPPNAHVVEIFPYHFLPTKVYETFANLSNLKYFRYDVKDSTVYLENMEKRTHNFTVHQCWSDNSCRPKVKQLPVFLPLEDKGNLAILLEKVIESWKSTCNQR